MMTILKQLHWLLLILMLAGILIFISKSYAVSTSSTHILPPTVNAKDQYLQILGNNTISFNSGVESSSVQCNNNQVLTGVGEADELRDQIILCAGLRTGGVNCSTDAWGNTSCDLIPTCNVSAFRSRLNSDTVRLQCTNVNYLWEDLGQHN